MKFDIEYNTPKLQPMEAFWFTEATALDELREWLERDNDQSPCPLIRNLRRGANYTSCDVEIHRVDSTKYRQRLTIREGDYVVWDPNEDPHAPRFRVMGQEDFYRTYRTYRTY